MFKLLATCLTLSLLAGVTNGWAHEYNQDPDHEHPFYQDDQHIHHMVLIKNSTLQYKTNRECADIIREYLAPFPELLIDDVKAGVVKDEVRILQERSIYHEDHLYTIEEDKLH